MSLSRLMLSAALLAAMSAAAAAKPVTLSAETNLRKAPGTKSEAIGLMPKGTEVEVGECDSGWCKVTWDGQEGYAIARNLGMVVPGAPSEAARHDRAQQPPISAGCAAATSNISTTRARLPTRTPIRVKDIRAAVWSSQQIWRAPIWRTFNTTNANMPSAASRSVRNTMMTMIASSTARRRKATSRSAARLLLCGTAGLLRAARLLRPGSVLLPALVITRP